MVRQQRIVIERSRLGIPALVHEECLTGFTTYGATVYPAAIAWGATFDPDLVERMAAAIGRDMARGRRAPGPLTACSTWCATTAGAGSRRRSARTRTSSRCSAPPTSAACRAPGSSRPSSTSPATPPRGRPATTVRCPMGRRELLRRHPAAVRDGHRARRRPLGDELLLRRRRRPGRRRPLAAHRGAARRVGLHRHGRLRLLGRPVPGHDAPGRRRHRRRRRRWRSTAGIDVELPDTLGFGAALVERVRRGELPEALVDRAARRLLTQKVQLGLLDPDWTPEGSVVRRRRRRPRLAGQPGAGPRDGRAVGRPARRRHRAAAARRRPPGAAPGGRRRALRGRPAHVHGLLRVPQPRAAPPPRPRARHRGPERRSTPCGPNCRTRRSSTSPAATCATRTARASPRRWTRPAQPTCASPSSATSPACSATAPPVRAATPRTCGCPGCRPTCSSALAETGTPVVVVVVSGRPYALGDVHATAAGLVQAFMPGEEGGAAIAGVLSGRIQPGGKLPVQIPRRAGRPAEHLPAAAAGRRQRQGISTLDPTPLFPFGYGASYTTFDVDDLAAQRDRGADRRRVHACRCACATPAPGPARRSSSSTCTTSSPR